VLPADHAALAHPDQHTDGVVSVAGVADRVRVTGADHLHTDRLLQLFQPAQRVPQLLGPLVVLPVAGGQHRLRTLVRRSPVFPSRNWSTSSTIRR
jgi:hypothetical protein